MSKDEASYEYYYTTDDEDDSSVEETKKHRLELTLRPSLRATQSPTNDANHLDTVRSIAGLLSRNILIGDVNSQTVYKTMIWAVACRHLIASQSYFSRVLYIGRRSTQHAFTHEGLSIGDINTKRDGHVFCYSFADLNKPDETLIRMETRMIASDGGEKRPAKRHTPDDMRPGPLLLHLASLPSDTLVVLDNGHTSTSFTARQKRAVRIITETLGEKCFLVGFSESAMACLKQEADIEDSEIGWVESATEYDPQKYLTEYRVLCDVPVVKSKEEGGGIRALSLIPGNRRLARGHPARAFAQRFVLGPRSERNRSEMCLLRQRARQLARLEATGKLKRVGDKFRLPDVSDSERDLSEDDANPPLAITKKYDGSAAMDSAKIQGVLPTIVDTASSLASAPYATTLIVVAPTTTLAGTTNTQLTPLLDAQAVAHFDTTHAERADVTKFFVEDEFEGEDVRGGVRVLVCDVVGLEAKVDESVLRHPIVVYALPGQHCARVRAAFESLISAKQSRVHIAFMWIYSREFTRDVDVDGHSTLPVAVGHAIDVVNATCHADHGGDPNKSLAAVATTAQLKTTATVEEWAQRPSVKEEGKDEGELTLEAYLRTLHEEVFRRCHDLIQPLHNHVVNLKTMKHLLRHSDTGKSYVIPQDLFCDVMMSDRDGWSFLRIESPFRVVRTRFKDSINPSDPVPWDSRQTLGDILLSPAKFLVSHHLHKNASLTHLRDGIGALYNTIAFAQDKQTAVQQFQESSLRALLTRMQNRQGRVKREPLLVKRENEPRAKRRRTLPPTE